MNICIVDDNSTNCYVLKELLCLEKSISSIVTYTEPEVFIDDLYSSKIKPDVVLTDIMMPVIDGYSLSNKIKQYSSDIRIIGITALPKTKCLLKDVEKCSMENVIFKPYDMKSLIHFINGTKA
jgi:CheY-like chemotaxis protein